MARVPLILFIPGCPLSPSFGLSGIHTFTAFDVLYPLNRAVELNNGSSHQQILYDAQGAKLAYINAQTVQKYTLPLANGVQTVFNSSGILYYRHADWLRSSRLALYTNGSVRADQAYAPSEKPTPRQPLPTAASPGKRRTRPRAHRVCTTSCCGSRARRMDTGWRPIRQVWPPLTSPTPRPGTDMPMWATTR